MVRVTDRVCAIETKGDLAVFVSELREDLQRHPDEWQNLTLDHYLESLSAWLADAGADRASANSDSSTDPPSWRTFGETLLAAKYYE